MRSCTEKPCVVVGSSSTMQWRLVARGGCLTMARSWFVADVCLGEDDSCSMEFVLVGTVVAMAFYSFRRRCTTLLLLYKVITFCCYFSANNRYYESAAIEQGGTDAAGGRQGGSGSPLPIQG
jgi:hypothetical protein